MGDGNKTNEQHTNKLTLLRQGIADLKKSETSRRKVVGTQKNSEEFFSAITQNATDIIIVVSKTGKIIYVSQSNERFIGYKPQEVVGKSVFDYIEPADLPRAIFDFGKAILTSDVVVPNSFRVRRKDGSIRIFEGVGKNLLNNPAVGGFVMTVRDVTERKKAEEELTSYREHLEDLVEERTSSLKKINSQLQIQLHERERADNALRQSEERFRTLIENSSDVISILNDRGVFIYNSPSSEAIFGYPPEYLIGKSAFDFIHPDDLALVRESFKEVVNRTNPGIPTAYRCLKGDGSWRWLESVGRNLLNYPGINGMVITGRDITERKQAEAVLKEHEALRNRLFESSFLPIVVMDSVTYRIIDCNAAVTEIYGFDSPEEMIGKTPLDVSAPIQYDGTLSPDKVRHFVDRALHEGFVVFEWLHQRPNGTPWDAEVHLMRFTSGDAILLQFTLIDITERKRAEKALRQSEAVLRSVFKATPVGVCMMKDRVYQSANKTWYDTFGYSEADLIGHTSRMLYENEEEYERVGRELYENLSETGLASVQTRLRRKDGAFRDAIVINAPLQSDDLSWGTVAVIEDITDRKVAEEALRESETRYQRIFENTGTGMIIVEEDMTISFANAEFENLTGYKRQEIEGKRKWIEFVDEADLERMIRQHKLRRIDQRLAEKSYEFRLVHKDGHFKYVYITVDIFPGTSKSVASLMDITEHNKVVEAKRESEQMIKSILSATPVGIGLTCDRRIKWVNEAWMQIFGFKDEKDCMDQPIAILYPSEQHYEESRRRIYTILENARIASIEAYMARQDGTIFPAQINVTPLDPSDLKKGAISTIMDISEWKRMEQSLRESEEKYRLAMDATSDALWDWDIPSGAVYYSPAWYHFLGETIVNHVSSWESRMHPDEKESVLLSLSNHLQGKSDNWGHEHRLRTFLGKWKWVLGRGSVISRDADGKPIRMVGTIINIDDRKLLESQLIQAQKMEAIGTLAGGIAHDFNNILASISGYTELSLMKEHNRISQENYLRQVLKACERAKNLVNQILLFSRQREGEKKPVDIKLIVKEVLKLLRASLPSTIKIKQNISPDPIMILADPTHIHQIVMNLCTNAAHAMRDHGGVLDVSISSGITPGEKILANPCSKIGPCVHLQVTDTGHGIDAAIIDRIFDPFFTTKKNDEGTGLGLSVVYGIIKIYDGIINVESKNGQGSTFDIYLPSITVNAENQDEPEEIDQPPLRGTEHILLIDDEKDIVVTMKNYLKSLGYEAISSTSSSEALKIFGKNPRRFDLIITDMTMPQMTGLKLSEEIHSIRPDIPIILCTGYDIALTEADLKKHGIREFVMKPILFSEISGLIRKVLDN